MKVLLLSVALLFLTGAHGRYFWQQDEPKQEAESDQTLQKILYDGIAIILDIGKNFDSFEIAKEYHIKEKIEAAKKHAEKVEKALEAYYEAAFKKFDEKLHEKFPIFRKKVVPILQQFDDDLEERMKKMGKELMPVGSDLIAEISKHLMICMERMENIAVDGRDGIRAEVENLRMKLQPYVDDVHAEYQKYHNELRGTLQQDYQELKEKVEKNVETIRERVKPHVQTIKSKMPSGKELQEKIEEFLKKLKELME